MSKFSLAATPTVPTERCAYLLVKSELDAISVEQLVRVDVDIPVVVEVLLNRLPQIRAARGLIASSLADFDLRAVDRLELYVSAMHYTHWLFQSTRVSIGRLRTWLGEWPMISDQLAAEARRLLDLHVLDSYSFDACSVASKPCAAMTGAQRLCCLFNLNWQRIEGTTRLRWDELAHAEVLTELASIAGKHGDDLPEVERILASNRQRAFTLFSSNYDQVRRAVQLVRRSQGDADVIAPPIRPISTRCSRDTYAPISTGLAVVPSASSR